MGDLDGLSLSGGDGGVRYRRSFVVTIVVTILVVTIVVVVVVIGIVNFDKLFKVHLRMKRLDDALVDVGQAVALEPSKANYYQQRADLLVSLGQCDQAVEDYAAWYRLTKASSTSSSSSPQGAGPTAMEKAQECAARVGRATEAYLNEQWAVAVHELQEALTFTEQALDLLFMKAQASYHTGDYYGAVSDTGRILKRKPDHLESYQLRGESYFRLGEHDLAVQHFREALIRDPEHAGCKKGRGFG